MALDGPFYPKKTNMKLEELLFAENCDLKLKGIIKSGCSEGEKNFPIVIGLIPMKET
jgi:hypothetical protein